MRINFSLKEDGKRPQGYLAATPPSLLHYEAYFADVEITFGGRTEKLPNVPMIYFVTVLQHLLFEAYITGRKSEAALWDTGHKLSLNIENTGTIVLEIPQGANPLRYPAHQFISALRTVTLELLWTMYDDEPKLLSKEGIFAKGSIQHQAAQLVLTGKLPRQ
jgi:hypothetical protein